MSRQFIASLTLLFIMIKCTEQWKVVKWPDEMKSIVTDFTNFSDLISKTDDDLRFISFTIDRFMNCDSAGFGKMLFDDKISFSKTFLFKCSLIKLYKLKEWKPDLSTFVAQYSLRSSLGRLIKDSEARNQFVTYWTEPGLFECLEVNQLREDGHKFVFDFQSNFDEATRLLKLAKYNLLKPFRAYKFYYEVIKEVSSQYSLLLKLLDQSEDAAVDDFLDFVALAKKLNDGDDAEYFNSLGLADLKKRVKNNVTLQSILQDKNKAWEIDIDQNEQIEVPKEFVSIINTFKGTDGDTPFVEIKSENNVLSAQMSMGQLLDQFKTSFARLDMPPELANYLELTKDKMLFIFLVKNLTKETNEWPQDDKPEQELDISDANSDDNQKYKDQLDGKWNQVTSSNDGDVTTLTLGTTNASDIIETQKVNASLPGSLTGSQWYKKSLPIAVSVLAIGGLGALTLYKVKAGKGSRASHNRTDKDILSTSTTIVSSNDTLWVVLLVFVLVVLVVLGVFLFVLKREKSKTNQSYDNNDEKQQMKEVVVENEKHKSKKTTSKKTLSKKATPEKTTSKKATSKKTGSKRTTTTQNGSNNSSQSPKPEPEPKSSIIVKSSSSKIANSTKSTAMPQSSRQSGSKISSSYLGSTLSVCSVDSTLAK